jgi:hypothetical protein
MEKSTVLPEYGWLCAIHMGRTGKITLGIRTTMMEQHHASFAGGDFSYPDF